MIRIARALFGPMAVVVLVAAAATSSAWAPLDPPKLDDRNFGDLVSEVQSLGVRLAESEASSAASSPRPGDKRGAASAGQTPQADLGSVGQGGAAEAPCCAPDVERLRAILERVRADRASLAASARAANNPKAAKQAEGLAGLLETFEKTLGELEHAPDPKAARGQFQTLSNVSKTLHDTAKAIIQNIRA